MNDCAAYLIQTLALAFVIVGVVSCASEHVGYLSSDESSLHCISLF